MSSRYLAAGVDIDRGDLFVRLIGKTARSTYRPEVLSGIGGFAAHFRLATDRYREPILVSCTDGVGTKLKIAIECGQPGGIGTDLVAMCVNDLACSGAEPLFFLDYLATGTLRPPFHARVIEGIAAACKTVGCALVGGETAEMPGVYQGDDFDLAGFAVGIVERKELIDGSGIRPGHTIVGVASTGFHSNGYSLLRKLCADHGLSWNTQLPDTDQTIGEALLSPTALYSPLVQALVARHRIAGIAHITGGGLTANIPRILPAGCQALIDWSHWELPPAMAYFAKLGGLSDDELRTVFNCGVGLVLVVPAADAEKSCGSCRKHGFHAISIGTIGSMDPAGPQIVFL
ncbi:MAG: phosphoribosylformylglycinamidine cyclo-ligase [Deltaproteobacteria bacterium]|nr:phosphoribosylformylglycinamidine cyclo-ligase [Deltaproteobacteria bacterium]